jgi:hypothetical protein
MAILIFSTCIINLNFILLDAVCKAGWPELYENSSTSILAESLETNTTPNVMIINAITDSPLLEVVEPVISNVIPGLFLFISSIFITLAFAGLGRLAADPILAANFLNDVRYFFNVPIIVDPLVIDLHGATIGKRFSGSLPVMDLHNYITTNKLWYTLLEHDAFRVHLNTEHFINYSNKFKKFSFDLWLGDIKLGQPQYTHSVGLPSLEGTDALGYTILVPINVIKDMLFQNTERIIRFTQTEANVPLYASNYITYYQSIIDILSNIPPLG